VPEADPRVRHADVFDCLGFVVDDFADGAASRTASLVQRQVSATARLTRGFGRYITQ
jgi:hypothetical protein